jgi:hypothetical protein
VTAAGFQLKGSGWYVTDFKGGDERAAKKPDAKPPAKTDGAKPEPAGRRRPGRAPASGACG